MSDSSNDPASAPASALETWANNVREEHAQADRVRSDDPSADHWKKLAHRFSPASREKAMEDETFVAIRDVVRQTDTVIDVGAGAGRLAIPLATICSGVTAVEPSEAMQGQLRQQAEAWGLDNLTVVPSSWQEAHVKPAEVVICAHVVYTVEEIEPFLRKLLSSAKREVLIVVFEESAMANYFELWRLVYGEERIALPTLPELESVLSELEISYQKQKLPEWQSRPFQDEDSAYEESLARLFITPSTDNADLVSRVRDAVANSLGSTENGLRFKWARPHRPWLVRISGSGHI